LSEERKALHGEIELRKVLPTRWHVLRRANCPVDDEGLYDHVETALDMLEKTARPRWWAVDIDEVSVSGRDVAFGGIETRSKKLSAHLGGVKRLTIMVATIGPKPEQKAAGLTGKGRHLDGMMLDAAASAMTEQVLRIVHRRARKRIGAKGTARIAPGYGDFGLEVQAPLLELAGCDEITVDPESHMMTPKKSSTGLVGWRE
jgi:hypothetical protein